MAGKEYDVIVIGTGVSGKVAAYGCASKLKTAIIDKREFGGTCELRGCDPKKVLIGVAEIVDSTLNFKEKNVLERDNAINWEGLMAFKKTFTAPVPQATESSLQKAGIDTIHGEASFIDDTTLQVGDDMLHAKHIVIATGAVPQPLPYEHLVDSEYFLRMDHMPKSIVFIGGGFISFELAHIARRAGAQVSIINRSSDVLKNFDTDLVHQLVNFSKSIGINILLNTDITQIEKQGEGYVVKTNTTNIACELIVHGAGRIPYLEDLHLEKAHVAYTKQGVSVNEFMQNTTNPAVYAVGDAASYGLPLTPVGGKEGAVAAINILTGNTKKADLQIIPSSVFTIPPLSMVGLTEEQAKEKNLSYDVHTADTSMWYGSKRLNEKVSGYKVLIDKQTNKIVGAHILGHASDEIINIFALAMKAGIDANIVRDLVYDYPTRASDIEYMA